MTKTYESGRESSLLADIKTGTKTVEVRLRRGKFARYQTGDKVWLREDFYQEGEIIHSSSKQMLVRIKKIVKYPDFKTMLCDVGFKKVFPRAISTKQALEDCYRFYTCADEQRYGVLAIYFELIITD